MTDFEYLDKETDHLMYAVLYGDALDVVRILQRNKDVCNDLCTNINNAGTTILHAMAQRFRPNVVKVLIDFNIDIDCR
jgi:ankyrin repeat protein